MKMATCRQCYSQFPARKRGQSRYCSVECGRVAQLERLRIKRLEDGTPVAGRAAKCQGCGQSIVLSHGHQKYCSPCREDADRKKAERYRARNVETMRSRNVENNAKRRASPVYREWLRGYSREYSQARRKIPKHRLDHRMCTLLRSSLRKGGKSWQSVVGYSIDDLALHLERQFTDGMTWENIGEWHVDHILPRSMFSYKSADCREFKSCWALTNLRPLWAKDNIEKSNHRTHLI